MLPRPVKPEGLETPGLNWRPRSDHWVAYWVARDDIVKRGYSLKSVRIWPPSESKRPEPESDEWDAISSSCVRLQGEMLEWSNGGQDMAFDPRAVYDASLASVIEIYQRDLDSPFHGVRQATAKTYVSLMATLTTTVGAARIPELTFRDFKRWYENFAKPEKEGGSLRKAKAHGLLTMVRIVLKFGALLKLPGCKEACETLAEQEFPMPKRREEIMTAAYDAAIRAKARETGLPSIALAQALMFGLGIRQKDAIGEWVPHAHPGISDVVHGRQKWLFGMHWGEAVDLNITHRLSKSLRGRNALLDPEAGKVKTFYLSLYPMVMEELAHVTTRVGPLVVEERTGLPWKQKTFASTWRRIARSAGVPDHIQNRDNRAGAATEIEGVADIETVRKSLGHSRPDTSRIYTRNEDQATAEAAVLRFPNATKTA